MKKYLEAIALSKNVEWKNLTDYILKNPLKLDSESLKLLVNQLNFNYKFKEKLKLWANLDLIAPPIVSLQQASSEFTGKFKQNLFSGQKAIDLTGGFGVDSFYLSQSFDHFVYNELNSELADIVKYNFKILGISNVNFENKDAIELINGLEEKINLVYLDPARRDKENKKQFKIEECEPNLLSFYHQILEKSENLLVKFSPILDIKLAIKSFQHVQNVYILAEKNEVKELLFHINSKENIKPNIHCISDNINFEFDYEQEEKLQVAYGLKTNYLYEPNAAIMKSGAFKSVAEKYAITKLAASSHLYTADHYVENFPGRGFKIKAITKYSKDEIFKYLPQSKANIACRNFIKTPEEIKKQCKIKDGGNVYLFFSQDFNKQKLVFVCDKIV